MVDHLKRIGRRRRRRRTTNWMLRLDSLISLLKDL
jgi:hypothetical protein